MSLQILRQWHSASFAIRIALFLFIHVLGVRAAVVHDCGLNDTFNPDAAQVGFSTVNWMDRGSCIRRGTSGDCYATLVNVLANLNPIYNIEYSGAATVLTLLPTIGALFGAPTSEIWMMFMIIPFGGWITMLVSFGGTMMPVKVEDYEQAIAKETTVVIRDGEWNNLEKGERIARRLTMQNKIRARLSRKRRQDVPKRLVATGLLTTVLILCGAQVAMGIAEQGGILQWRCSFNWWMHLWYILVTVTSITENLTNLPFTKQWKLHISKPPWALVVQGGESVTTGFHIEDDNPDPMESVVQRALSQLSTLSPGDISIRGSSESTEYRNSMMVIVSVAPDEKAGYSLRKFWRLVSRVASLTVFVTGTMLFSNVALLSLPISAFLIILVLAAGVFGRAISSGIVASVAQAEPMLHVITDTEHEACKVIGDIFALREPVDDERGVFQTEIEGHVFVSEQRVAHRSPWYVKILGVMVNPFDIRKAVRPENFKRETP